MSLKLLIVMMIKIYVKILKEDIVIVKIIIYANMNGYILIYLYKFIDI